MRIVFVQTGDFKEAVERFDTGKSETYGNQSYTVDYVADLVSNDTQVIVICTRAQPYDVVLSNGVRAIAINDRLPDADQTLLKLIKSVEPTHLIARTPNPKLIEFALSMGARVLPLFADSFAQLSFRQRWRAKRLVRILNNPSIEAVSNHNINASRSLCTIGVDAIKVIPYDYIRAYSPDEYAAKETPKDQNRIRIVYVGVISQNKGTFDVINALSMINSMGLHATLTVVGDHEGKLDQRLKELGIEEQVKLLGKRPNSQVIDLMRSHDAVIVPSRPSYPEGMPNTIFESLATRTPLIASNHPMFTPVLRDEENCVMFNAGDPQSIADATQRLINTPGLYHRISSNTPAVWKQLVMPFVWHEVIDLWLSGTPQSIKELQAGSILAIAGR